ncbi:MAG: hypothetical protein AB9835_01630 [Eubacteriales bacterium]
MTTNETTAPTQTDFNNPALLSKVTSASLRQTSEYQERWLSVPFSRLVVNPFNFNDGAQSGKTQSDYCNRPNLPLNIGFLSPYINESRGLELNDLVTFLEGDISDKPSGEAEVWRAPMDSGWKAYNKRMLDVTYEEGGVRLSVKQGADPVYQQAIAKGKINVRDSTAVSINIASCTGTWALKVSVGNEPDIVLIGDNNATGPVSVKLAEKTGWSGETNINFIVWSIAGEVVVSDLSVMNGEEKLSQAGEYSTYWQPDLLGFSGQYPNGVKVTGEDWFYDTKTIVREIEVTGDGAVLAGRLYGDVSVSNGALTMEGELFRAVINTDNPLEYHFYPTYSHVLLDTGSQSQPFKGAGAYAVKLPAGRYIISVSIDTPDKSMEDVIALSATPFSEGYLQAVKAAGTKEWDDYLAKVPRPSAISFDEVDAMGVTNTEIMDNYYASFVFLYSTVLPENPETGYNYPQVACGKPSMWGWGDKRAAFTAAWDSIYGMQLLSFVEPQLAMDCFTGLMSLVERSDDPLYDGMIAGESLPVNRARTAWILYKRSGDLSFLEQNFENLHVNLIWSKEHPYWIYQNNNPIDSQLKDSDFTAAVLVDIPYMVKICEELGNTDEASYWAQELNNYTQNYYGWNFNDGRAVEIYPDNMGHTLWVTKGLYIKQLDEQYADMLMERFIESFNPDKSFGGFTCVKVEQIMYTAWGLADRGHTTLAKQLLEVSIRDIVRSRFLAEAYDPTEPPTANGVRPSIFGMAQLISSVWMKCGYRYDSGDIFQVPELSIGTVVGLE